MFSEQNSFFFLNVVRFDEVFMKFLGHQRADTFCPQIHKIEQSNTITSKWLWRTLNETYCQKGSFKTCATSDMEWM